MLTKAQFFALLNDADNEIGATAHIAVFEMPEYRGGMQSLIIKQNGAPNAWLSNHKAATTTNAAFTKYHTWLNEWLVARTAEAEARLALTTTEEAITLIKESPVQAEFFVRMTAEERMAAVEAAHTEALAEDAERAALRCRDAAFFGGLDAFGRRVVVEAAHAEALELNDLRDFRIDAPQPAQVARTASITARLQSHIVAPVLILLMLLIGGSFNADAAPVEHWICGGQQVSYDGNSITVDGWRFTHPLDLIKKQEAVTFAAAFENTSRQMVMLVTAGGHTIFAGDYYPQVFCTK